MQDIKNAVTIRNPSTANLLIDSTDRTDGSQSSDFAISLRQSILNGFFTRLAVVEVVLDWCVDNVSAATDNNTLTVNVAGTNYTATITDGHYTVASLLAAIVAELNTETTGTGISFNLGGGTVANALLGCDRNFTVVAGNLAQELNLQQGVDGNNFPINCPLILPYTYIDIVSSQLTYCQDLKDATSNPINRDTLYRWYFAWDGPAPVDTLGYPINQGYMPFIQRRYLSFPKQIKWDNIQPIGQMSFQVYDSQGVILNVADGEMEWRMSILVSEQ